MHETKAHHLKPFLGGIFDFEKLKNGNEFGHVRYILHEIQDYHL